MRPLQQVPIHLVLIGMLLLAVSGIASAQTYHVSITHRTNLRASYSLRSGIVDVAAAGTTLAIIGSHENWLRIEREGGEAWMADWVPYTRVEGQQPASSDIDNCCFVDRQCTNDQEWTDGYWAMQNNQCGTPTPQVSIVAPPITTVTSDVDNCCHLGWSCQTDHEWERGFWNYQVGQCEHQGVIMEGSEQFKATMDAALRRLTERSQHWYWYTLDGLSKIREVTGNRIRVSSRGGDNRWGTDAYLGFGGNTASLGALLAHEACHVHRWRSGQNSGGVVGETACVQIEVQALDAIGPDPRRRNRLQYLLDNIHDPAVQWWHD